MQMGTAVRILHPETDGVLEASGNVLLAAHQVYLKPAANHDDAPMVQSAFILENVDKTTGGLLRWGEEFRLKHIVTGKYVSKGPLVGAPCRRASLIGGMQTGGPTRGSHLVHLNSWAGASSQSDLLFSAHSTEGHGADQFIEVSTIVTLKNGQLLLGSSTIKGSAEADEKQTNSR